MLHLDYFHGEQGWHKAVHFSFLTFWSWLETEAPILALCKAKRKQSLHLCQKELHRIKGNKNNKGVSCEWPLLLVESLSFLLLTLYIRKLRENESLCWYLIWIICEDPGPFIPAVFTVGTLVTVGLATFIRTILFLMCTQYTGQGQICKMSFLGIWIRSSLCKCMEREFSEGEKNGRFWLLMQNFRVYSIILSSFFAVVATV